jgi:hypothetical protein
MFDIPLSEASMSEVLARVSYRVIQRRYFSHDYISSRPLDVLSAISDGLVLDGFGTLATWVLAYRRQWSPIYNVIDIREQFILDARQGYSWRRVAYPQYKSRRHDPRVTNRGVARDDHPGEK